MLTFLGFGWRSNPKFTEEGLFLQPHLDFKKGVTLVAFSLDNNSEMIYKSKSP